MTHAPVMLAPHFSLDEMCVSETAARQGISNTPPTILIPNLERLAEMLEQVRVLLGNRSVLITSGYRNHRVNKLVGGSENSQHIAGLAADFICPKFGTPTQICRLLSAANLPFDQLIHEYGRWVHISIPFATCKPRRQILTIDKYGTRPGIQAIRS